jgi:hypothetical protein
MGLVTEMHLPSAGRVDGGGFTYRGDYRYQISLPTRRAVFTTREPVLAVLDRLGEVSRDHHFEVIAYTFLPDRLVMVVRGKLETSDMRAFLSAFRAASSEALAPGLSRPLWSRKFLERVVRKHENIRTVVRDLYRLPVLAGLASSPESYSFQGSFTGMTPDVTSPRATPRRQTAKPQRSPRGPRRPGGGTRGGRRRER